MRYENLYKNFGDTLALQEYAVDWARQNVRLIAYGLPAFFLPFFLGHPQWLVGSVVNCLLVVAALELQGRNLLPVILLPSLGALSRGLLFGPFTPFLAIMVPFIWAGNALLVAGMKSLYLKFKQNYWVSLGASALLKTVFLFACAFALVNSSVLPALFLTTMGATQFVTAAAGGALAFALTKTGLTKKLDALAV